MNSRWHSRQIQMVSTRKHAKQRLLFWILFPEFARKHIIQIFYSDIVLSFSLPISISGFEEDDANIRFSYFINNNRVKHMIWEHRPCLTGPLWPEFLSFFLIRFYSFGPNSIDFQCHYSRSVSANSDITVNAPISGPIVGTGDLTYNMEVNSGTLGGLTHITIAPNHNISGISPRLVSEAKYLMV